MDVKLSYPLYPKQQLALDIPAQFKMYGGAAGGGKSHLLRVEAIKSCLEVPSLNAYLFRRNYNELYENHMVGLNSFPSMLSPLVDAGLCQIVELEIRFWNDSRISLCHAQHIKDVYKWKGPELNALFLEEATEFDEEQIRFLVSRNRIPKELKIPDALRPFYPKILATTNPTGPSHQFWKSNFIDGKEPYAPWRQSEDDGGRTCVFIPALLRDNPSLDEREYRASLMFLKRPELIDALLHGKWDIPLGAFLPECDERKHLVSAFEVPKHWFKFRTFDWGSGAPFCVQWWAVSDGYSIDGSEPIPRGSLVCYREWYGAQKGDTRRGLALSNEAVARGILERSPANEDIHSTISDQFPFKADGGVTIAEQFAAYGVPLTKGDNSPGSRIQGAQQLRSRLIGIDGSPSIYFFRSCVHTWRTLTTIQTDSTNLEDADSDSEDHAYDCTTHACKVRPWVKDKPVEKARVTLETATFNDALSNHFKTMRRRDAARR